MRDGFSVNARLQSIRYALDGLKILWCEQHNARVHLLATVLVIMCGLLLAISATEWILVLLLIGLVWVAEALNSAVEYLCDRVTTEQDPLIGKAKDAAAAGVLIASIIAVAGGLLLFIPALLKAVM